MKLAWYGNVFPAASESKNAEMGGLDKSLQPVGSAPAHTESLLWAGEMGRGEVQALVWKKLQLWVSEWNIIFCPSTHPPPLTGS